MNASETTSSASDFERNRHQAVDSAALRWRPYNSAYADWSPLRARSVSCWSVSPGRPCRKAHRTPSQYQRLSELQRATTGTSFGNEFRHRGDDDRLSGDLVCIDYAANVRSLGCEALEARDPAELRDALAAAREARGPVAIVTHVEPRRGLLHTGAWWDIGVAQVSTRAEVRRIAAARAAGAETQRLYY